MLTTKDGNQSNDDNQNTVTAYIALGSNLDMPLQHVNTAIDDIHQLSQCHIKKQSPWYASTAVGPGNQPDYINGVIEVSTDLQPLMLLEQLQAIENAHDRQRTVRWGARTLDLDILLYDQLISDDSTLTLPHPRLHQRNFVLIPLFDIAPELLLPNKQRLRELVHNCSKEGLKLL